jgi:hypothetical protein
MSEEARTIWVYRNGELVDKRLAPPLHPQFANAPGVIRDTIEPTMNPANGKRYDSKRAYERAVRAAGCEIAGNEKPSSYMGALPIMPDPVPDIKAAIEQVESRKATVRKRKRRG